MKGLGIGIVFTSIILLVATGGTNQTPTLGDQEITEKAKILGMVTQDQYLKKTMTDEQVIEKAKQLGMVTQEEYSNKTIEEEQIIEKAKELGMVTQEEYSNKIMTDEQIIAKAKELGMVFQAAMTDESSIPKEEPAVDNTGTNAILVVTKGMNSIEISKKLEELGVVEDWEEFERYLEINDFDGIMRSGTFRIDKTANFETIAKILTKSKN
jgi:hypothetical protein